MSGGRGPGQEGSRLTVFIAHTKRSVVSTHNAQLLSNTQSTVCITSTKHMAVTVLSSQSTVCVTEAVCVLQIQIKIIYYRHTCSTVSLVQALYFIYKL